MEGQKLSMGVYTQLRPRPRLIEKRLMDLIITKIKHPGLEIVETKTDT